MTAENMEVQSSVQQEQVRLAQLQQVRNALVQNIFSQYYQFINALQVLPVDQRLAGMQRAYGHIDDGMLWIKEIINTSPLVFASPSMPNEEKTEEPTIAPEEQAVDSLEQCS